MDIHRPRLHRPVRRQKPLHQILQPIGFLDDDLRIFAQARVVQFVFEQLRRAADAAERILDFMSQIADQLAARHLLLEQPLFARRLQLLIDRPEFDEQLRRVHFGRIDRAVQMQHHAVVALEFDVLAGVAPAVLFGIVQRFEQGTVAVDHAVEGTAEQALAAHRQQIFGGRIHVTDRQRVVEQEDRGRQQVESAERVIGMYRHTFRCSVEETAPAGSRTGT